MSRRMVSCCVYAAAVLFFALTSDRSVAADNAAPALRPPAVPLVTSNPFLSIWSCADRLTDDGPRHWTNRPHTLTSLLRIDGKAFRVMGKEPADVPAMTQTSLRVLPTRTIYTFQTPQVALTLTFMTPSLPEDFDVLARPVTYITWDLRSLDGQAHAVAIYASAAGELAVNQPGEMVTAARETMGSLTALRIGTEAQPILGSAGDDHRVNWGHAYLAATSSQSKSAIGGHQACASAFVEKGELPKDDGRLPRPANDDQPVIAFLVDAGQVGTTAVSRHLMIGYDEIFAINYFGKKLRPYWRRNGDTPADLFQAAEKDYANLAQRCEKFDEELMADLRTAGGERYAIICALAYRQALAGCGWAADPNGQPLIFTKENTSNGCIATVDVFYPAAPQFLLMGPAYAKALVASALVYSASPRWKFSFAPHDLGTYPRAVGQAYAGGERSTNEGNMMPVEESGNMIILCDAIARMEGNADFASRWWPQLTKWENYLEKFGLDPENQLCTDDFMGHLAHNSNLSIKAILAIACYGDLCRMRGDTAAAEKYMALAKADAKNWMQVAADGDHYRIAFDKPNTWSQKYNLVWDRLLGLNVFPPEVAQKEIAYYKKMMQRYGVPLDSRTKLTKTDWCLWTATMAESPADFQAITSPIYDYLNETTARQMFADSYITNNPSRGGMHARPVIGGLFIKMLADPAMWKKWASRDKAKTGNWATVGARPQTIEVIATSREKPVQWRYTFEKPAAGWNKPDFDASSWKEGSAGFGTRGTPGITVNTEWRTDDIWLRREVTLPAGQHPDLQLLVYHDEDVEIYVNGVLAGREPGFITNYEAMEIRPAARALLTPGAKITLAVHCHQTQGGQGVDVGFAEEVQPSH